LQEILDRTGYSLDVTTGQRKYGGPPPGLPSIPPGPGHEVGYSHLLLQLTCVSMPSTRYVFDAVIHSTFDDQSSEDKAYVEYCIVIFT